MVPLFGQTLGMALVGFIVLVVVVLLVQIVLALYVLERAKKDAAARLLAAYMMLQSFAWIPILAATQMEFEDFSFQGILAEIGLGGTFGHLAVSAVALAFLAPALLGFSLCYPTRPMTFRRQQWLLNVPFVLSIGLAIAAVVAYPFGQVSSETISGDLVPGFERFRLIVVSILLYLVFAVLCSTSILTLRRKRAVTSLERDRIRYMNRWILHPSLFGLGTFAVFGLVGNHEVSQSVFILLTLLTVLVIVAFAIVPPFALAYGLLRYRLFDLEQKVRTGLRFTVRSLVLLLVFMAVFFSVTNLTGTIVTAQTQNAVLGTAAAFLVTFVLHPVQDAANRLARRAIPPDRRSAGDRQRLVYRATYEDLSTDGRISPKERRALESLAGSLGLAPEEATNIEAEVMEERRLRLTAPSPDVAAENV